MPRTRIQAGGINTDISASGKKIWVFRWRETKPDGRRAPRKRVIGTLEEFPTRQSAEDAARPFRSNLTDNDSAVITDMTMEELVEHFREHELINGGDEGRAYSTRKRYQSVLEAWVSARWKNIPIAKIRTVAVEQWLRSIPRANGTKAKIRNTMSALYNHAIRWEFTQNNPIRGIVRGAGVRQSAKRLRIPDILDVEEFQRLQGELGLRERVLVWLDMSTGLRRGELAGLRWEDVNFADLTIWARRSVVDNVVGPVKTETSQKPIPVDPFIAEDLMRWKGISSYPSPEQYVFATDSPRAGENRGRQPLCLATVMRHYIQPAAKRVGIIKRIGWHTFRRSYSTLLHKNGEVVKVVQELLRHGSSKVTLDVYAQAVTSAKRRAQQKVVSILREE